MNNTNTTKALGLLQFLLGIFFGVVMLLLGLLFGLKTQGVEIILKPQKTDFTQVSITPTPLITPDLPISLIGNLGQFPADFSTIGEWINKERINIEDPSKIKVVTVGRMYCSYCLDLYPYLTMMHFRYPDDISVMGILYEKYPGELNKEEVIKHLQDNSINITIGLDTDKIFVPSLGEDLVPVTYVIDENNTIVFKVLGLSDFDNINEAIKQLLNKKRQ